MYYITVLTMNVCVLQVNGMLYIAVLMMNICDYVQVDGVLYTAVLTMHVSVCCRLMVCCV